MTKRDVPGFAIGGLSGGEEKDDFWRMVTLSTDHLPRGKPRYLMGVGCVHLQAVFIFITVFLLTDLIHPPAGTLWIWWCASPSDVICLTAFSPLAQQ